MSQPKPSKVIIKNLQDIINNSKYSTSSLCGISNVNNFQNTQNSRLSSPKSKKHSIQPSLIKLQATPQKSTSNKKYASHLNNSLSKHSLKSKQKINIVSLCKDRVEKDNDNKQENQFSQTNSRINSNKKNNLLIQSNISSSSTKKHHVAQTHNEKYSQPNTKIIQKKKKSIAYPPVIDQMLSQINLNQFNNQNHIKSLYFNQIDVIFTELQDFLRQIRQEFVNDFNFGDNDFDFNDPTENFFKQDKISKLEVLSEGFKEEVRKVFCGNGNYNSNSQGFSVSGNQNVVQSLLSKTTNSINPFTNPAKQSQPSYKPLFYQSRQRQAVQTLQIQQFMQRQNTINSTILSPQDGQQSYLPTQTDTQLLSMLVFKNKVNNTKRKYQQHAGGNTNNGQNQVMISSRSGMNTNSNTSRKKDSKDKKECQYSFRNNKDMKQNVIVLKENPSSIRFNTDKKKKQSQYSSRQKDEKYQTFTSSLDFTKKNYYKQTPINKKKEHKQKHHFYTQKPEISIQKQNKKPSYCTGFSATKSSSNWNTYASKTNSKNTSLNYNNSQRHAGITLVTKKQNKQKSIYELVLEQNKKANKTHYMKNVA